MNRNLLVHSSKDWEVQHEGAGSNNDTLAVRSPNRIRRSGEQEEGGGTELVRLEGPCSLHNGIRSVTLSF